MADIIVIGGSHHNTLSVLRSLGEFNVHSVHLVLISTLKHPYVKYSRFKDSFHQLNDESEIVPYLLNNLTGTQNRPVIIACGDPISSELDQHMNILTPHFVVPGTNSQGRITTLMNKDIMCGIAEECGFNIPVSKTIDISQISTHTINSINFPCIVKPLSSISGSKDDIHILSNISEFNDVLPKIECNRIQVQDFIHKKLEYQLIGCSINGGEEVIIPGASIIIRQPENTNTGFLKYLPSSEFDFDKEACVRFMRKTGYSGLFSMEFLRDENNIDYFMETNFRNDGNAICVTAAGVNLPYIWYLANSGGNFRDYLAKTSVRQVYVMPELDDLRNVRRGKLSFKTWLKDIHRSNAFMEFSKSDPMPLIHYLIGKFIN